MPRKSAPKGKRVADMSITELVQHTEKRIEEISQQRIAEVRALFDQVLARTQLNIREVYGQVKGQVSDAMARVGDEWDSAKAKAKDAASAPGRKTAKGPAKGSKLAPKFRHPDDPNLTWAGRGAQPVWLREAIAAGADIESFRVGAAPSGAKGKAKRATKKPAAKAAKPTKPKKSGRAKAAKAG